MLSSAFRNLLGHMGYSNPWKSLAPAVWGLWECCTTAYMLPQPATEKGESKAQWDDVRAREERTRVAQENSVLLCSLWLPVSSCTLLCCWHIETDLSLPDWPLLSQQGSPACSAGLPCLWLTWLSQVEEEGEVRWNWNACLPFEGPLWSLGKTNNSRTPMKTGWLLNLEQNRVE